MLRDNLRLRKRHLLYKLDMLNLRNFNYLLLLHCPRNFHHAFFGLEHLFRNPLRDLLVVYAWNLANDLDLANLGHLNKPFVH